MWPTSDVEPFASFIYAVPEHVATSSPLPGGWAAAAIEGDVAAYGRSLREGDGGDVGVHASIALLQSLLAADLVDELQLVVASASRERTGGCSTASRPPGWSWCAR
ncbi:dihydrofolate reductase family protein [Klenkia sp. PcliD-1-E]|uniref:dihydrofolate reductase family protein n=1 Tax=Klenkia sp. PcliD-1-E TaxID=2954492 RepID=UPI002097580E|nr:dihydrofolate reductase family protein [Klenkia sp. PcliD-1-E]MCO7220577.1 dihydrofolate reductase family protein [Klenkia sp. PcliD-1-E]